MPRKSNENRAAPAPAGLHRKPRPDLYTVFLVIALVAVLLGILFLFLEMQLYEFKIQGAPPIGMVNPWPVASGQWSVDSSFVGATVVLSPCWWQYNCHPNIVDNSAFSVYRSSFL